MHHIASVGIVVCVELVCVTVCSCVGELRALTLLLSRARRLSSTSGLLMRRLCLSMRGRT